MNLQTASSPTFYIGFRDEGNQTWSLENICMNLTSDSNQVKIYDNTNGHLTYAKKVNVGNSCPNNTAIKTHE